jgi:Ca-activated chloride channel family protein
VQLVELRVTVRDAGGQPVTGLRPDEVAVREGRRPREIDSVTAAAESTLTVGIVVDVSSSMLGTLPDLQEAAMRFLDSLLQEKDRAAVIAFADRAQLIQPMTTKKDQLRKALLHLHPSGSTALYDAMILGLLQFEGVKGRRALVVFTDGDDTSSTHPLDDVKNLAARANVPVFVISGAELRPSVFAANPLPPVASPGTHGPLPPGGKMSVSLRTVARSTGGDFYAMKRLDALPQIYDEIAAALRAQFVVGIRSNPGGENEWRPLKIEVRRPGVRVHAPSGYYAPQ